MKKFALNDFALKKFLAALPAVLALAAPAAAETVTVFAAASMTEALNAITGLYRKEAPDVTVVCNFDSSGTLKTQIQEGAECDVFISAGRRQMDQLDAGDLDLVLPGTRFDLVANEVVLIVPKGKNPRGISSFADAATDKVSLIALGNSDVPAGQYAREIFTALGIWDKLNAESKITFAGNVKEALAQVAAGAADCGVVYGTDAASSDGVEIVARAPAGSHRPAVYPAALLRGTKNESAARAFVAFLKGEAAGSVLKNIGFSVPPK